MTRPTPSPTSPRSPAKPASRLRDFLTARYAERTGRSVDALPWYQILATWKAAIFLEGSFGRFSAGTTTDPYFGNLEQGVPALAALARERTRTV